MLLCVFGGDNIYTYYGFNYKNFVLADEKFLGLLHKDVKNRLSSFFYEIYNSEIGPSTKKLSEQRFIKNMNRTKLKLIFSYCLFCNHVILLCDIYLCMGDVRSFTYCPSCGESDFMQKAINYQEDIDEFISIIKNYKTNDKSKRLLINQLLVVLSTQIECFAKNFYAALLNMRLIKFKQSSFQRFLKDCGNDFINPGKANRRLKKELQIDLKKELGEKLFLAFTKLSAYRNVIVHNNGKVDKSFLSQINTDYKIDNIILVTDEEIELFKRLYIRIVSHLILIYDKEFLPTIVEYVNMHHDTIIYNGLFLNQGKPSSKARRYHSG